MAVDGNLMVRAWKVRRSMMKTCYAAAMHAAMRIVGIRRLVSSVCRIRATLARGVNGSAKWDQSVGSVSGVRDDFRDVTVNLV